MDPGVLHAYAALAVMAIVPIYLGSYAGLRYPKQTSKQRSKSKLNDDEDDDDQNAKEFFSFSDAKMYPLVGSAVLFSLYLLLKFVSKDIINTLLTANFTFVGYFALAEVSMLAVRYFSGNPLRGRFLISLTETNANDPELWRLRFGYAHMCVWIAALATTALYAYSKHWILSNAFGEAFSIASIQLLSLDSFATGMLLLAGLFLYDIFWVFGTEVMVTVAKGLDVPIKVTFPKNVTAIMEQGIFTSKPDVPFTMLGLGDIVIPGIFVALCLAFDHYNHLKKRGNKHSQSRSFSTPYFSTCFIMYILGLVTTIVVMHTFQTAQPALLYLSPACIFSALGVAYFRGELVAFQQRRCQGQKVEGKKEGKLQPKNSEQEYVSYCIKAARKTLINLKKAAITGNQAALN
ncbi:Minor histocompatibility antigen H13 [Chytriomyces hyalinus]|nr:Minor histocompatibility antigen H13 [Chytriomyces hyalinus]